MKIGKGMTRLIILILACLCIRVQSTYGDGQTYAAVLTVRYSGVELLRANTGTWLPLPLEAVAPFGPGDVLRTNETGRAQLSFLEDIELLVLSNSEYTLEQLDWDSENGYTLSARLNGHLLHQHTPDTKFQTYQLQMSEQRIVNQPAALFAVWADGTPLSVLTIAEGTARLTVDGQAYPLADSEGARIQIIDGVTLQKFEAPLNAARFIGLLDGCPGNIETIDRRNLNVRVAPGLEYPTVGAIPSGQAVQIMGVNRSGDWYRVQAFSGFGWVQSVTVKSSCTDLPVLDFQTEQNQSAFSITQSELSLLTPFYGDPKQDLWFYRSVLTN